MQPPTADRPSRARDAWRALDALGGLCGPTELAEHWGVDLRTVKQVVRRADFPPAATRVGGRALWLTAEADDWRARRPRPGRASR